jgi:hypothetical protein
MLPIAHIGAGAEFVDEQKRKSFAAKYLVLPPTCLAGRQTFHPIPCAFDMNGAWGHLHRAPRYGVYKRGNSYATSENDVPSPRA